MDASTADAPLTLGLGPHAGSFTQTPPFHQVFTFDSATGTPRKAAADDDEDHTRDLSRLTIEWEEAGILLDLDERGSLPPALRPRLLAWFRTQDEEGIDLSNTSFKELQAPRRCETSW